MKIRSLLPALLALVFSTAAVAQEAAPEPTPAQVELQALVADIGKKLRAGDATVQALAPELKRFDELLEKYSDQKTDDVAQIALMQAMLHLQVFDDYETGATLLKALQAKFPETQIAARIAPLLAELEPLLAARKVSAALKPGAVFPAFAEQDMNGKPLALADYKGKVVLIDFWATWCGPCFGELPNVIAAYEKYHAKGFEIIGISLDDNRGALESFLKEKNMTWAQHFDGQGWKNKLAKQYGISSIPATFLVDREGRIVATDLRGADLENQLAQMLR